MSSPDPRGADPPSTWLSSQAGEGLRGEKALKKKMDIQVCRCSLFPRTRSPDSRAKGGSSLRVWSSQPIRATLAPSLPVAKHTSLSSVSHSLTTDLARRSLGIRPLAPDRSRLHRCCESVRLHGESWESPHGRNPLSRELTPPPVCLLFVAQFYETLASSFSQTEALWEGLFSLASSVFILLTGLSFVRLDRARVKWRVKLARAFSSQIEGVGKGKDGDGDGGGGGRWALWGLPFLTVLREGLEGIVSVRISCDSTRWLQGSGSDV